MNILIDKSEMWILINLIKLSIYIDIRKDFLFSFPMNIAKTSRLTFDRNVTVPFSCAKFPLSYPWERITILMST